MVNLRQRSKQQTLSPGIWIAVALFVSGCQTIGALDTTNDATELRRTWDAAHVYLPADGLEIPNAMMIPNASGKSALRLIMDDAQERNDFARIPNGKRYPVVIYLHGCIGLNWHSEVSGIFLASELGVAVIQPVSFAREYRPKNCYPTTNIGGTFRQVLRFRIAEANYSIREARKLAWIDAVRVILMGKSEGGITTAKFNGESVNARIIEAATCHHAWSDWDGFDAPENEPALSLLGRYDPVQKSATGSGRDCGSGMPKSNGSKSIVVTEGYYANKHEVLMDPDVQQAVIEFIKAHIKN